MAWACSRPVSSCGSAVLGAATKKQESKAKSRSLMLSLLVKRAGELRERLLHPLRRERQRAQPYSRGVCDGIGDRRGGRALRAFAHAEETLFGAVEKHDFDSRHIAEVDDRVVRPGLRGDARA